MSTGSTEAPPLRVDSQGADDELAIVTRDLRRAFDGQLAVDGVDLAVEHGEIYGFLGPNGAGKTTCVRMLCTLLRPSSGTASVAGFDVAREAPELRLRIGVAMQEAALDDGQTGSEFLRLQARLYGLRGQEVERRARDMAEMLELGEALDRAIGTYSGGMKRRLDVAAALIHNPEVVFLDEPTTGLDPISRVKVWEEVRRVNSELGTTIFLTTQYLEEADTLAGRVGIIDHGRIVAEGAPEALKRSLGSDVIVAELDGPSAAACDAVRAVRGIERVDVHADELTILVADGSSALSPVAVALDGCGVTVRSLTLRTPTLDDVFLELTGGHIQADGEWTEEEETT
ncbi:MAG: ATP-binding cassette domain-containing protein [Solirubrobacterales bacterium]